MRCRRRARRGVAGCLGGSERLVHVSADLGAHGRGLVEVGVVAAGVERGGELEERLAGFQRDGGAAPLNLRRARAQRRDCPGQASCLGVDGG